MIGNVQALSLNECSLSDIDGISAFANLNRLSLKNNNLTDITPLGMYLLMSKFTYMNFHGYPICCCELIYISQ